MTVAALLDDLLSGDPDRRTRALDHLAIDSNAARFTRDAAATPGRPRAYVTCQQVAVEATTNADRLARDWYADAYQLRSLGEKITAALYTGDLDTAATHTLTWLTTVTTICSVAANDTALSPDDRAEASRITAGWSRKMANLERDVAALAAADLAIDVFTDLFA